MTCSMIEMIWIFIAERFACSGDVLEIFPAESDEYAYRVEFFGDEIDRITEIDVLTGKSRCAAGTYRCFSGIALCCADG